MLTLVHNTHIFFGYQRSSPKTKKKHTAQMFCCWFGHFGRMRYQNSYKQINTKEAYHHQKEYFYLVHIYIYVACVWYQCFPNDFITFSTCTMDHSLHTRVHSFICNANSLMHITSNETLSLNRYEIFLTMNCSNVINSSDSIRLSCI